jgi:hypothetical protein
VERARAGLPDAQAKRVEDALRQRLNDFSITARLKYLLSEDGVPVAPEDLDLLRDLRTQRNEALHGGAAAPAHDDVDRGVAFLSRAITTRWHEARY